MGGMKGGADFFCFCVFRRDVLSWDTTQSALQVSSAVRRGARGMGAVHLGRRSGAGVSPRGRIGGAPHPVRDPKRAHPAEGLMRGRMDQ